MRYVSLLRFLAVSLTGIFCAFLPAAAQNGRYEVRLVPAGADCGTKKGLVRVQLRAATVQNIFRLGNASLRFDFDPSKVKNLVLKTEEAFSSNAPASDGNYAPQALTVQTGSTLATASLSIFYTGTNKDARQVGPAWLSVATLEYDVAAPTGCVGFTWHTDTQFPVTGMTEVVISSATPFVFSEKEVPAAGVFTNLSECVLPLATARLSGDTTIFAGGKARLTVTFDGQGPWSFTLSDSTTVTATNDNPRYVEVAPTQTGTFTLAAVSGACGVGTGSGQAVVTVNEKPAPTLALADFTPNAVCAGQTIAVAFTTTGDFNPGNTFSVQLSDSTGTTFTTLASGTASPIAFTIPPTTPGHSGYRLRLVASSPSVTSVLSPAFRVKPLPTVLLSGTQTIQEGQSATLTLSFTGEGPWSFKLSDGTTGQATTSPHTVKLTPTETDTYTVESVSNACGTGNAQGEALVTVTPKPAPTLALSNFTTTEICAGQTITVAFTTTGDFNPSNTFAVQLSDSSGTQFKTLASGNAKTLTFTIPATTPGHPGYRLRIVASSPATTSPLSPAFRVKPLPTALLSGTQTIRSGQPATLSVALTGQGPWSFRLSDSTLVTGTTQNPHPVVVNPTQTTTYTLTSVSNACGTGTSQGNAVVTVKDSTVAFGIALNSLGSSVFCAGQTISLGYTLSGTPASGTTYRLQLSDAKGENFTTFSTDTTLNPLSAVLPGELAAGTGYRFRVVALVPGSDEVISEASAAVTVGHAPTAVLSGDTTLAPGQTAQLKIKFTGLAPWSFGLSDSTLVQPVTAAEHLLTVSPDKTTTYTLKQVSNACGAGSVTGQATITVQKTEEPPVAVCKPDFCVPYLVVKTKRKR
jgi:hypothetical protein